MERLFDLPDYATFLIRSPESIKAELDELIRRQTWFQLMVGGRPAYRSEILHRSGLTAFAVSAPHDPELSERIAREALWMYSLTANVPCQIAAESLSISSGELWLQWPHAFLRLQRRDAYRIRPQSPFTALLKPMLPSLGACVLYDISAHGIGLAFDEAASEIAPERLGIDFLPHLGLSATA